MIRISVSVAMIALCVGQPVEAASWQGHAGNAQHTAQAPAAAQNLNRIRWKTPIDIRPQLSGDELLIHYGSAIITAANTLILPVKVGATGTFRVEAHNVATGAKLWQVGSDYILPPHNWTPMFGPQLTLQNRLYFPGTGGTILYRDTPDQATGARGRIAFYGNRNFVLSESAYESAVDIDTPLTSDNAGDIFFGFTVTGSTPLNLQSGVARVGADGKGVWVSAATASGDSSMTKVQTNSAPAISNDQGTVYVTVSNGSAGYLVGLDATTLQPKYKVRLKDPSSGNDAWIDDDSSATPTVGPDGDVYIGVLETPFPSHNDRGWLLHFDAALATVKTPGSFGWDDTTSIVPASAVPSYTGTSTYLLMMKYNNYIDFGIGNGHNLIAIVDPNARQKDEYHYSETPVTVMKEVLTIAGPTPFPGGIAGQTYEWCISSAAVDPSTKSVIVNSEDGHTYRWDLANNTISQSLLLNSPRPEAYTQTVVGVDGTVYVVNNATFYAIGN
jgi:hypothetical protein